MLEAGTFEARDAAEAERSPLAKALMELPGVGGVFFAPDFISVTKTEGEWSISARRCSASSPSSSSPARRCLPARPRRRDEEFFHAEDAETVETIKELIETRVRPAVAGDGGDIVFKGFRDGIVYLDMKGACSGCPSSTATLKHGIENLLKHFLPDQVKAVEPA